MAGVNIVMTANTERYVAQIKNAQKQGNKSMDAMGKRAKEFGDEFSNAFQAPGGAITGFLGRLGPVGMALAGVTVAAGAMAVAIGNAAAASAEGQKQLESLAKAAGLSTDQMNKQAIAANTVGISMEQYGDILKDASDKMGDFMSTGGGGMQDYFDTIHGKVNRTIDDFRGLSSLEALQLIQQDLDLVGAGVAQQTFVLEAMASEASKLSPILRMSEKDLDNMLSKYATKRSGIAQDTMNDIQATQNNLDTLHANFNAALTNSFSGLIGFTGQLTKGVSDLIYEFSEAMKKRDVVASYVNGGGVDSKNASDVIKYKDDIKKGAADDVSPSLTDKIGGLWEHGFSGYGEWLEKETSDAITKAMDKVDSDVAKAKDIENANSIRSKSSGTAGNAKAPEIGTMQDSVKSLQTLNAQRTSILREQGRLETQLQNATGEETRKALQEQINVQKSLLEVNANNVKAVNNAITGFNEEAYAKRKTALQSLVTTEEGIARNAHQQSLDQLRTWLQEGALTQDEFNQAKLIAEQTLADKLVAIKDKQLKAERDLEQKAFNEQQALLQGRLSFAQTKQEQYDLELEMAINAANREAEVLNEKYGKETITEQQILDRQSELRREHRDKEIEEEIAHITGQEEREVLKWEKKKEFLDEQYANGLVSEQVYAEQSVAIEQKTTEAKRVLMQKQLDQMSALFAGMSQNLEKGSKSHKAAFLLEKAATIANLTLAGFDHQAAIDKDNEIPVKQKPFYKIAAGIQTGAQIAGAMAVTLGQFHSGTDEVDSSGSYILKAGERVVQPEANKDLTKYLDEQKNSSSSEVIIKSDLIINGGSEMSEDKINEMFYKHRENLAQMINLANREKGM